MNYKLYVVIDNFVSFMQCALDATDIDAAILPSLLLRSPNTPLHYREEIVSVIEAGFKMYLRETRPDRPIPKKLKIKQPKVSIFNLSHISIF